MRKRKNQNQQKMSKPDNSGRIALFPGSFDPFTRGHESIVERALPLFDKIVIAVGVNLDKKPLLDTDVKVEWIKSLFADEPRVSVISYEGLTVDVARKIGAHFMLRGVRMVKDFEYERELAEVNRCLAGIETVLLYTLPEFAHVSSTTVRELLRFGHSVADYLPVRSQGKPLPKCLALHL